MGRGTHLIGDWPNLASMMFERARRWHRRPMLRVHRDGAWQRITWGEFAVRAAAMARGLRAAGVNPGDRVIVVAENRPEVVMVETALMAIRAVPVPAYTTYTVADFAHVITDCGARAAIASTTAFATRLADAAPLELLVTMEDFSRPGLNAVTLDSLMTPLLPPEDIIAEAATIPPGAMACLIYTSGTGGAPKGVMTPHRAILSNCRGAANLVAILGWNPEGDGELYLSYLPLSHSYEHTVGQFFMFGIGAEVAYSRGTEVLAQDIAAVRPTIMTMVPRVLEVIRARILAQVAREKPWRRRLFALAQAIGEKRIDGRPRNPLELLADPILDRLVRAKVRARFGGRLRAAMSGGARLEPEVGRFFLALGIPLLQGYGQTEAGPVISANPPDRIRIETVGPPLEGVELKLADDGEILVRGDLVMDGYWNRPDDTAAAIRDGWLHTGDIGALDGDGYLRITDRKKDMIVLSGGENVSPARIEGLLIAEPAIAQAVLIGDGRAGLTALVVAHDGFDEVAVAQAVGNVNKRLSVTERIRRHAVVPPFTIDGGTMTATQKVRRHIVRQQHAALLERLGA